MYTMYVGHSILLYSAHINCMHIMIDDTYKHMMHITNMIYVYVYM